MSITDELREWAVNHRAELDMGHLYPAMIEGIADRIDAEHEAQLNDAFETRNSDENLEEDGWVRLPLDAEGVPIRIGDVMEWQDCSTAEVVGIGNDTFFYVEDGEDAADWSCASDKIHRHIPTVEEVLREFALAVCKDDALTIRKDVVAEYAAKLRLAGDE